MRHSDGYPHNMEWNSRNGICSRHRYHDGPCNGFPRSVDSSKGVYCYTPRPIAVEQSLGQYIDKRLREGDRLAADNRELKEQVKRLQGCLKHFEANCACGTDYDPEASL